MDETRNQKKQRKDIKAVHSLAEFKTYTVVEESDCLIWNGSTDGKGYGLAYLGDSTKIRYAHRIAWALAGDDPGNALIAHTCGNKLCVNVKHMKLTSKSDALKAVRQNRSRKHALTTSQTTLELIEEISAKLAELKALVTAVDYTERTLTDTERTLTDTEPESNVSTELLRLIASRPIIDAGPIEPTSNPQVKSDPERAKKLAELKERFDIK